MMRSHSAGKLLKGETLASRNSLLPDSWRFYISLFHRNPSGNMYYLAMLSGDGRRPQLAPYKQPDIVSEKQVAG